MCAEVKYDAQQLQYSERVNIDDTVDNWANIGENDNMVQNDNHAEEEDNNNNNKVTMVICRHNQ